MNDPKIFISGAAHVEIQPIVVIDDAVSVGEKFARIAKLGISDVALRLSTATGDAIASVADDEANDLVEELATVICHTTTIAGLAGIKADTLLAHVNECFREMTQAAVLDRVNGVIEEAGAARLM